MAFLATADARIYYETAGESGPWISLVNGHTRSSRDFRLLGKGLVRNGFRVLSADNRGAGLTESDDEFSLEDMAGDWLALWKQLGIEKTHLAGLSMGGIIAQILVSRASRQIESLTLISSTPGREFMNLSAQGWSDDEGGVMEKLNSYFSVRFQKNNSLLLKAMAKQIAGEVRENSFNEKAVRQRNALMNFQWEGLAKPEHNPPAQIIHGDEDLIIAPEAARVLANRFHGRLHMIPEAGHLLLGEKPRDLEQLLLSFFKECG